VPWVKCAVFVLLCPLLGATGPGAYNPDFEAKERPGVSIKFRYGLVSGAMTSCYDDNRAPYLVQHREIDRCKQVMYVLCCNLRPQARFHV
jgi:hypothetical protein